jgi:hypothetical protein
VCTRRYKIDAQYTNDRNIDDEYKLLYVVKTNFAGGKREFNSLYESVKEILTHIAHLV